LPVVIPLVLVWLRGAGLVGQALALGGATFALAVLGATRRPGQTRALARALTLAAAGGLIAALAQLGVLSVLAAAFADHAGWPLGALLGSAAGTGGAARVAAGVVAAGAAFALRRSPGSLAPAVLLLVAAAVLPLTGAVVSHATGRVGSGVWLVALGALHQAAASVWVGGLVCAVLVARAADVSMAWLRPFSGLAAGAVATLAVTGIAMSLEYIATPGAAIGTSYGAMVLAKIALFLALLAMGALNHRALRRSLPGGEELASSRPTAAQPLVASGSALLMRRRAEVEAGLAVVALLLAASIASAPPGADAGEQQVTLAEVGHVFTPRWPRLQTPSLAELQATSGLGDPDVPRTSEETAWSEFGHNVAGLFILAMGVLAILERTGRAPWARHWPLLIVALAAFVAWSLDPEGWQTGLVGFWEHLLAPEVLQHRIMLGLTALLGAAEWRSRIRGSATSRWRYVFPAVCIASGTLLLSHVHEVENARTAFLMEVAHLPLGLLALLAGWSRWLELRLPPADGGRAGRLWAPALAAFGLLLVFYREG
jgi:putative copper resistance protein D